MGVFIKNSSGERVSNDYLNMTKGDGGYTTSRNPVSEGKWYFEFTHHSGDQYHLVCFRPTIGFSCFYPQNRLPSSVLYNDDGLKMNVSSNYHDLNLDNVEPIHTIGIGIDIDEQLFLIRSKDDLCIFSFNVTKGIFFYPFFREADTVWISSDILSINFGDKIFSYIIPDGFQPWSRGNCNTSHQYHFSFSLSHSLYNIIILITQFSSKDYKFIND